MTQCSVLRCQGELGGVFRPAASGIVIETIVCTEHLGRLDAGEPYSYERSTRTILMGKDLQLAGLRPITKFTRWSKYIGLAPGSVEFQFEYADGEASRFVLTREAIEELRKSLNFHFPAKSGGESGTDASE